SYLSLEEDLDPFAQRYVLGVSKLGVGLGVTVFVQADRGVLVSLRQRRRDRLAQSCRQLGPPALLRFPQNVEELPPIHEKRRGQGTQKAAQRFLFRTALGLLPGAYLRILLLAHGEVLEGGLLVETADSIRTRLEVQPEWPLDRDLAIAEVSGREDLRDDDIL